MTALEPRLPFAHLVAKMHHEDITRTQSDWHKIKANSTPSPSINSISTEIDKMKINELKADHAEKLEVAQAVKFANLTSQAQLLAQYSQMQSQCTKYFNKLFFIGNEFTPRRLD